MNETVIRFFFLDPLNEIGGAVGLTEFGKENLQYNKQVKGYMQLLTKMGYKNITGYLWYVDEELIVKVK